MTQGSESSSIIHPTLHHFGVVTRHLEKMVEWYAKVVGMVTIYQSSNALGSEAVVSMSAAFGAASVEWLCRRYGVPCPSWVYNPAYSLPEPWFDSPGAHKPRVRERLLQQTPEPFARRNVYCGNRIFANKYEFAEQYQRHSTIKSTATPTFS